jgi:hypothetical protein
MSAVQWPVDRQPRPAFGAFTPDDEGGGDTDIDIDRAVRRAAVIAAGMALCLLLGAAGYYILPSVPLPEVMALASP